VRPPVLSHLRPRVQAREQARDRGGPRRVSQALEAQRLSETPLEGVPARGRRGGRQFRRRARQEFLEREARRLEIRRRAAEFRTGSTSVLSARLVGVFEQSSVTPSAESREKGLSSTKSRCV
jgi:hypothetical protein